MFKNILVPTDGSAPSIKAAKAAIGMAKEWGGKITAVFVADIHVLTWIPAFKHYKKIASNVLIQDIKKHGEEHLRKIEEMARKEGINFNQVIREGHPDIEIVKVAEEINSDVIVIGSVGGGRASTLKRLLGSVSAKVVEEAKCPVLVYR